MASNAASPASSSSSTPLPTSSSASTPSRIAARGAPLTTPFVQSPECASIWELTRGRAKEYDSITGLFPVLASNAADERFSSCQPSGWDDAGPSGSFGFGPAVCPSAWTYYSLFVTRDLSTVAETHITFLSAYSHAYCCASLSSQRDWAFADLINSGMTLARGETHWVPSISTPCTRFFKDGETTISYTDSDSSTGVFTGGMQIHEAWRVTWHDEDTSTLSPPLPSLDGTTIVQSWVPGQTLPPPPRTEHGPDIMWVLYVVTIPVPIIGLTVIGLIIWCLVRRHKRKKRERREEQEEREAHELTAIEPESGK
ncbi:hypothetical protein FQN52_006998 [Onygenales sp. PD_12]|nr:hypothetical protein FQN52_006998 [Onygenales sp. PD_12]